MSFGKFWPAFAQASPFPYLSPTYLGAVIINEVKEKMEREQKQRASTNVTERHKFYLESRLGQLIKLKDCQHLKDVTNFPTDNDVLLSPPPPLKVTMGELLTCSKLFCLQHLAENPEDTHHPPSFPSSANTR